MVTWGVLRLPAGVDAAAGAGEGAVAAGVAAHLDGLVAVAATTAVSELLTLLPADVTRIVELDAATATDPEAGTSLGALLAIDDGSHAALIASRPVADALKRVESDVVIAGLERDGLLTPEHPRVFDRAALAAAVRAAGSSGDDAVALLLAVGSAVGIVTSDGPVRVHAEGASSAAADMP